MRTAYKKIKACAKKWAQSQVGNPAIREKLFNAQPGLIKCRTIWRTIANAVAKIYQTLPAVWWKTAGNV